MSNEVPQEKLLELHCGQKKVTGYQPQENFSPFRKTLFFFSPQLSKKQKEDKVKNGEVLERIDIQSLKEKRGLPLGNIYDISGNTSHHILNGNPIRGSISPPCFSFVCFYFFTSLLLWSFVSYICVEPRKGVPNQRSLNSNRDKTTFLLRFLLSLVSVLLL